VSKAAKKRRKPSAYEISLKRILGKGWRKGMKHA